MTHFPHRAVYCRVPLATLTPKQLREKELCSTRFRPLSAAQCAFRSILFLLGALAWFALCFLAATPASAKGAKGGKTAHFSTHAAHRASLARSPKVAATLAFHGQGSAKHVGAAMMHTWFSPKHKL